MVERGTSGIPRPCLQQMILCSSRTCFVNLMAVRSRTPPAVIHAELQAKGVVGREEHRTQVLVPRQDLTGADRIWAARYNPGDVLRYSRGSKETGIGKGEYARVVRVDADSNRLTVERKDGTEIS